MASYIIENPNKRVRGHVDALIGLQTSVIGLFSERLDRRQKLVSQKQVLKLIQRFYVEFHGGVNC